FFFSSRRRHTRFSRDWSSDVCSSDLHPCVSPLSRRPVTATQVLLQDETPLRVNPRVAEAMGGCLLKIAHPRADPWERPASRKGRSEERRVGKECRSRWTSD